MKLPNHERAIIREAKIVTYLLNVDHPRGGSKAVYFMRFGFTLDHWRELEQALIDHAATWEVKDILVTDESTQYTIEGEIKSPDSRNPFIRSVWAIDADSDLPRFITAYPVKQTEKE